VPHASPGARAVRTWSPDRGLPVTELQLATLVAAPPEGPAWLHEQKFDGYRILAELVDGHVRLLSRRFKEWTAQFPTVAAAVAGLPARRAVLDGEVAVVLPDGRTSFQALQNGRNGPDVRYFVFDLLALDDEDLTARPLEHRKARLAQLLSHGVLDDPGAVLRYSDHITGNGAAFFQLACQRGLEGIISKQRAKPYAPGRGLAWQKTKCLLRQELVVGGFTDPEGSRTGFGALLVGYYEQGALIYAGKVGTGFDRAALFDLHARLTRMERTRSPFTPEPPRAWTGSQRHWVAPELVVEVAFGEWTADRRLRHPVFQGLREDKRARDVGRELPAAPRELENQARSAR
jgi:bifunctional non-homologous end joining protein LigD